MGEKCLGKLACCPVLRCPCLDFEKFIFNFHLPGSLLLLTLAIIQLSFYFYLPTPSFAEEGYAGKAQNVNFASSKRNSSFIIQPTDLQKFDQSASVVRVDVRSPDDFEKARIPNTLNIPLHAVKSKQFLKNLTFVLINAGENYRTLEEEAIKLKSLGFFNVKILAGGMSAWRDAGGRIDGDPVILSQLNEISPRDFNIDSSYDDWILINTSSLKPVAKDSIFSQATHIPFNNNQEKFVNQVQSTIFPRDDNPLPFVLILNSNGDYGHIKYALRDAELTNIFYLSGGIEAYRDFLEKQVMLLNPGGKKTTECETCPQ
jgi:rhodanese-related sulfurtransferase